MSVTRTWKATFHTAGLANGGKDAGAPGLRPHYDEDYFGAFLLDPEGNGVEAVCHRAEDVPDKQSEPRYVIGSAAAIVMILTNSRP